MVILYLCFASVAVLAGAGIATFFQEREWEFRLIFGFTAGAVLGFVLMFMIHLFMEVGYVAIIVLWGGFLLIWLLEKLTNRMGKHLANQASGKQKNIWGVNLTLIGLSIHSIGDGFNLSVAAGERALGIPLALAILLHRLPIATIIASALRQNYGFTNIVLRLMPLIIAPFIGAYMGEQLLHGIFLDLTEYLAAFAAGTLLHVVMDGFRSSPTISTDKISYSPKIAFVIGLIITICAIHFIPGVEHEHVH